MTQQEKDKLKEFIEYYISAFDEVRRLEAEVETINKKKEDLTEKISSVRREEEEFLSSLRKKYGEDATDPARLVELLGYNAGDFLRAK
jgi:hypothetical protein